MSRRFDLRQLNDLVARHRLVLWWLLWLPLYLATVGFSFNGINLSPALVSDESLTLWYKVLNAGPLLFLMRLAALALGLSLILICLFLPVVKVGSEGVSWNRESCEEMAKAAGEAAGEEVELLVSEETRRWRIIQNWLQLEPERFQPAAFVWEFLFVLHEVFPADLLFLLVRREGGYFALTHPFMPFLSSGVDAAKDEEKIQIVFFLGQEEWLITVRTEQPEGYSRLDQEFLSTLGVVFAQAVFKMGRKELFPDLAGFAIKEVNQLPEGGIR